MSEKHLDLIEKYGYIVIIDEEVGVIDAFKKYSTDDLAYLSANGDIEISDEDGMISWYLLLFKFDVCPTYTIFCSVFFLYA